MPRKPLPRPSLIQPADLSYRYIPLTKGQVAIVDLEDYDHLMQFSWHALWSKATQSYYAVRNARRAGKTGTEYMHRAVMNAPPDSTVDHIHHNTLDNRKAELRHATKTQNTWNTKAHKGNSSGLKGVSLDKQTGRWLAQIRIDGKNTKLGRFSTPELAHQAYQSEAIASRGDFNYGLTDPSAPRG